ncbi:Rho-binding antiterminator [Simiduia curdlanivorans]|uniref:Rho-binding antiterminator n=1 Tax=Simiduia curdlanivorans TaxID=1492769 RepID=A0ABV8V481_9GAMM|nr:Rho-binding antiterminator [Simiduia curdlanivorans]MDN3640275.1 Rho-binding antiterminator [Simiduia curdlanivorans]
MPISCQAHDYVEIVCMRASKVHLLLHSGAQVMGIAEDITRVGGIECLQVKTQAGAVNVDLTRIKTLEARDNLVSAHNFIVQLSSE